ncbi:hypothetical protein M2650_15940 [Luteimonas sp. SX5]|uniref:Transcriptional regulator n=2 Tax=Luteimonas galliterrae TaxID=2940486 RepID=A0ABT0MML1_9GAMM|nr:hypothetical protein [Luteimonas galliterrae]
MLQGVTHMETSMARDANKGGLRMRVELDPAERALLIRGLRTMWHLHVDSQIAAASRLSTIDRSQRAALETTDVRLLEIRALAGKLGAAIFGD